MPPGQNKNNPSQLTHGQRLDRMARKREERATKNAYKLERKAQQYQADDETFASFSTQLAKMGLQLRDIPGDGNCLFRALGDQLEGHGRNHLQHRHEVVKFMHDHRADFEPFVEDDVPFDRHVTMLNKQGTYAGNDAIVAFARLHKLNVVIHQLNSPVWQVHGTEQTAARQLHISYHNGDHYSSVRRVGDQTETPANIKLADEKTGACEVPNKSLGDGGFVPGPTHYGVVDEWCNEYLQLSNGDSGLVHEGISDLEQQVMGMTGCQDEELVREALQENAYDVEVTVVSILQVMEATTNTLTGQCAPPDEDDRDSGIWAEGGTGTRIFGGYDSPGAAAAGAKPKQIQKQVSTARRKREKKLEKKARATERRRQEHLGSDSAAAADINSDDDREDLTIINDNFGILKI